MRRKLVLNFSRTFEGQVWNIMALPHKELVILEIRHEENREVTFSAYQYKRGAFLWEDLRLEEAWWVSLAGSSGNMLLFGVYDDMQNPGFKTIIAVDALTREERWRKEDFVIQLIRNGVIEGYFQDQEPRPAVIHAVTGNILHENAEIEMQADKISDPVRPFQYMEGNSYFETIKKFLEQNCDVTPVKGAEYLEANELVFISYYVMEKTGLANYLLVMHPDGELLAKEKLGGQLRGLGVETFFILSGYLFFVRNKREFLSYQIQ